MMKETMKITIESILLGIIVALLFVTITKGDVLPEQNSNVTQSLKWSIYALWGWSI